MKYIDNEKVKSVNLNDSNYFVAFDFDKTITALESHDSWFATGRILGPDYKKEMDKLYKIYAPIEMDYNISFEEKEKAMVTWYGKCMDMFYDYGLTESQLEKSVKESKFIFREGAKELLEDLHKKNIPTIILSAGIGNAIECFLKDNDCLYDNITLISNFVSFDENGKAVKYTNDIIHTLNKNINNHMTDELTQKILGKEKRVLFGDFIEDKNIIPKEDWDKTISVGFLNSRIDENLGVYKDSFDIVLTDEDATFKTARSIIGI